MVFYLGWAQGFPRKNLRVHYFSHICLLLCRDQAIRSTRLPNLRKFGKNTIHPPLVSCTLKLTEVVVLGKFGWREFCRTGGGQTNRVHLVGVIDVGNSE